MMIKQVKNKPIILYRCYGNQTYPDYRGKRNFTYRYFSFCDKQIFG